MRVALLVCLLMAGCKARCRWVDVAPACEHECMLAVLRGGNTPESMMGDSQMRACVKTCPGREVCP